MFLKILLLLLHTVPAYFIYKGIYDVFHNQAIWVYGRSGVRSEGLQGFWLALDAYQSFIFAFLILLFSSYQMGRYLANRKRRVDEKPKNPTLNDYLVSFGIELSISLLFVPLIAILNSSINPW